MLFFNCSYLKTCIVLFNHFSNTLNNIQTIVYVKNIYIINCFYLIVTPAAPVLFVSRTTSNSIFLQWKPNDQGGSAILSYTLTYRRIQGDTSEITFPRRVTSYELRHLQCGTTYHLALVARNKIGLSPSSSTLSVRTQGQPPGLPTAAALLAPNSTSLLLRLGSWPDNGCPLSYFVIQYKQIDDDHWNVGQFNFNIFPTYYQYALAFNI